MSAVLWEMMESYKKKFDYLFAVTENVLYLSCGYTKIYAAGPAAFAVTLVGMFQARTLPALKF